MVRRTLLAGKGTRESFPPIWFARDSDDGPLPGCGLVAPHHLTRETGIHLSAGNGLPVPMSEAKALMMKEEDAVMAHAMEELLKSADVVVMEREAYENLLMTIERQNEEIKALDRIKTLKSE